MVLTVRHQRRAPADDAAAPPPPAPPAPPPAAWPDELALSRLCSAAVASACDPLSTTMLECLRESLLADLADDPPVDVAALTARVADVALSLDLDQEQAPAEALAAALWRALDAWREAAAAASADDLLPPGCCELCERRMPLTRHHLIPRRRAAPQAHPRHAPNSPCRRRLPPLLARLA